MVLLVNDPNEARFLCEPNEFPIGCGSHKGQALGMSVILAQKHVNFSSCIVLSVLYNVWVFSENLIV
jgi:hypothetical protein